MATLATPIEPLGVEYAIDFVRASEMLTGECRRESLRIRPPALEAGAMTGRQRGRLVEEKQLGIAGAPDVSMPSLEVEATTNPSA